MFKISIKRWVPLMKAYEILMDPRYPTPYDTSLKEQKDLASISWRLIDVLHCPSLVERFKDNLIVIDSETGKSKGSIEIIAKDKNIMSVTTGLIDSGYWWTYNMKTGIVELPGLDLTHDHDFTGLGWFGIEYTVRETERRYKNEIKIISKSSFKG